ncbi:hypothetical protein Q9966_013584 [Columba livia]|nr:hypothetical protein Q9966_013584 [Columba livia]
MREEEQRQQGDITVKKCDEKQPVEEQILAGGSFAAGQKRDIACRCPQRESKKPAGQSTISYDYSEEELMASIEREYGR